MILSGRQAALRKSLIGLSLAWDFNKLRFETRRLVALYTGGCVIQDLAF